MQPEPVEPSPSSRRKLPAKSAEERQEAVLKRQRADNDKRVAGERAAALPRLPDTQRIESWVHSDKKVVPRGKFDPFTQLLPDDFVIHNGNRRTGKSWLDRYWLYAMRHWYRCGEVFSGTSFNGYWQRYFPREKVFQGFHPGVLRLIMDEQARVVDYWQKHPEEINPYRVLVFDDVAIELTHAKLIDELACYARHYKISVHILTQHPQRLSPATRSNADVVTVFPLHNRRALNCLREDYLPMMNEQDAVELLTAYSIKTPKSSQALVIVNREGSAIDQRVFTASVPDPGPFIMGCEEYWRGESTLPNFQDEPDELEDDTSNLTSAPDLPAPASRVPVPPPRRK